MSNDNNSPFKTTWAGQDARIHQKKLTWSVGNYQMAEPVKETIKDTPVDTPKDNVEDASYKWLLAQKLSRKLR